MADHPAQPGSDGRRSTTDGADSAPTESFAAASSGAGGTAGATRSVPGGVGAPGRAAPRRVLAPEEPLPPTAGDPDDDATRVHRTSAEPDAPTTALAAHPDDRAHDRAHDGPRDGDGTDFETFSPDESGVVAPEPAVDTRRGTTGLGLLVLRLALGGILVAHSLQKLFGLFGGSGIDGFASLLEGAGYPQATTMAWVGAVTELAAGGLLVLGLLTPLAAAAALGVLLNAWFVREASEPGFTFFAAQGGTELEILLVVLAVAVALAGPGRISLDARRRWATRPTGDAVVALVLGAGAGLAVWFLLVGANPFA